MNQIVGYDTVGDKKFPRFSGPCKGCGAEGYGLSTSGPDYCGACACGVNPEVSQLRRRNDELFERICDAEFAVGLLTGHFPPFNDHVRQRAERFLAKRREEWEQKAKVTTLKPPQVTEP